MGNLRGLGFLPNATVSSPEIAALKGLLRDDGGIPIIYKAVFPGKVALGGVPLDTTAKNTFNFPAFRPVFQPIPSFARWSYGRSNCGIQRLKRCNWTPWCLGVLTAGVFMKGTVKDWWGELVNKKFQAGLKHLEYRFALYWSFLLGEIERERERSRIGFLWKIQHRLYWWSMFLFVHRIIPLTISWHVGGCWKSCSSHADWSVMDVSLCRTRREGFMVHIFPARNNITSQWTSIRTQCFKTQKNETNKTCTKIAKMFKSKFPPKMMHERVCTYFIPM